ncbi:MAG: serpin family protein [Microcoleaceae cyanobacterium]
MVGANGHSPLQESGVEVNETGTEAAAVTSIISMRSMSALITNVNMIVNRPFFFAIIDNESGSILFMGEITNPENSLTINQADIIQLRQSN